MAELGCAGRRHKSLCWVHAADSMFFSTALLGAADFVKARQDEVGC